MFGVNTAFSGPSVHTHELHLLSHKITVLNQGTFLDGVTNLRLDHIVFGEKSGPEPILFLKLGHPEYKVQKMRVILTGSENTFSLLQW